MKGIELARLYYEQCGKPMLEKTFPELLPFLAVGIAGSGSECCGYDDEISKDHDFTPEFCVFLPDEETVSRQDEFRLERALAKLPKKFMGFSVKGPGPVGEKRRGVIRAADFFTSKCGNPDGLLTAEQWLHVPEALLAEAVNGEIFFDEYGEVTAIRQRLSAFPADIQRKKLAGCLITMAQAGQYNYARCAGRGEVGAAVLSLYEFAKALMHACFMLNGRYMPYYKWSFRALRELPGFKADEERLLAILKDTGKGDAGEEIEALSAEVAEELRRQGLCSLPGSELEALAYAVNDGIKSADIRNLNIFEAV